MSTRIPRTAGLITLVSTIGALALFVFFNNTFGGPRISTGKPYEVSAVFEDSQGLVKKALVQVRGVKVGDVSELEVRGDRAIVKFTLEGRYAPVYRNATARAGLRTFFGEPYVDLDPGSRSAGELADGGRVEGRPSVEYDEALEILDEEGRRHFTSLLRTFGRGARSKRAAERTNATYHELSNVVHRLRQLSDAFYGEEQNIAGFVQDGRAALAQLGDREQALVRIVSSGRQALEALAARQPALEEGFAEAPRLLGAARRTLADARPLLQEARPLVVDLRTAAPDLRLALADLRPVSEDARAVVAGLRPLNRAAVPTLERAIPALEAARPMARALDPALRNLVPVARYLSPRANGFAAFFANTADMNDNGDSDGKWTRFIFFEEPGEVGAFRAPHTCHPEDDVSPNAGVCNNAYPEPGDAVDNEPYEPGSYPRLMPFEPPSPNR